MSKQTKTILKFSSTPMFLLFVALLILKTTGTSPVADWSYWWVTAPLWMPIAIFFAICILWFVILVFVSLIILILDLVS